MWTHLAGKAAREDKVVGILGRGEPNPWARKMTIRKRRMYLAPELV